MKKNILQKYFIIVAATLLQSTLLKAETWVTLPYPQDIAQQLKDDQKKVDLEKEDEITYSSLQDLFNNNQDNTILIAAVITQDPNGQLIINYEDAYTALYKPIGAIEGDYPYFEAFSKPLDALRQPILVLYFFFITRKKEGERYTYHAKYYGDIKDTPSLAALLKDIVTFNRAVNDKYTTATAFNYHKNNFVTMFNAITQNWNNFITEKNVMSDDQLLKKIKETPNWVDAANILIDTQNKRTLKKIASATGFDAIKDIIEKYKPSGLLETMIIFIKKQNSYFDFSEHQQKTLAQNIIDIVKKYFSTMPQQEQLNLLVFLETYTEKIKKILDSQDNNQIRNLSSLDINILYPAIEKLFSELEFPEFKNRIRLQKAIDEILKDHGFAQFELSAIRKVFDEQLKPQNIKMPLKDFQNIIQKKSVVFAPFPDVIFNLIHDYAPLLEEYQTDKNGTLEDLNLQFMNIVYDFFPRLNPAVKPTFILNLKKIKSTNDVLQGVIAGIIEDYEQKEQEEKLGKIINKILSEHLETREVVALFDTEIKPLKVKIPLDTFKKIIKEYDMALAWDSPLFLKFIHDNLPLIKEYGSNKEKTTEELYREFIKIIQDLASRVLPDTRARFIANLKNVSTTNPHITTAIARIIEDYTKEQEEERKRKELLVEKTLAKIQDVRSVRDAAQLFKTLVELNMPHKKTSQALKMIIDVLINKANDPYSAFTLLLDLNFRGQELDLAVNDIINTAKKKLLSLTPQEEGYFINSFKKIGDQKSLFKNIIEKAINNAPQQRAANEQALLNLAQALTSI